MGYEDVHRRAGFPWYYPLVFVLNIALIIALELMFVYKLPVPMTGKLISRELPEYENATLHRSLDQSLIGWYLMEMDTGEYHVVPVRRHSVFINRCKLCSDQIVVVPGDTAEMEVTTKAGINASTILVGREVATQYGGEPTGQMELRPKWYGRSNAPSFAYGIYFFSGLGLSLLEYLLWKKLKAK